MLFWIIVVAIVWGLTGLLSAGLDFAFYQKAFPSLAKAQYKQDLFNSYILGLLGPVSLYTILESSHRRSRLFEYGVKFW